MRYAETSCLGLPVYPQLPVTPHARCSPGEQTLVAQGDLDAKMAEMCFWPIVGLSIICRTENYCLACSSYLHFSWRERSPTFATSRVIRWPPGTRCSRVCLRAQTRWCFSTLRRCALRRLLRSYLRRGRVQHRMKNTRSSCTPRDLIMNVTWIAWRWRFPARPMVPSFLLSRTGISITGRLRPMRDAPANPRRGTWDDFLDCTQRASQALFFTFLREDRMAWTNDPSAAALFGNRIPLQQSGASATCDCGYPLFAVIRQDSDGVCVGAADAGRIPFAATGGAAGAIAVDFDWSEAGRQFAARGRRGRVRI